MAAITRSTRAYNLARLQREIAYTTSTVAILGNSTIDDTNTFAEFIANEITTTGYSRCLCTLVAPTPTFNATSFQWETEFQEFTQTISGGATLSMKWIATLVNATHTWSAATIGTVSTGASTIAYPTPAGVTPANDDRVIVTVDAGGTLPGGVSSSAIYQLKSVSNVSGTTTAKIRALGSGTDLSITTTGSGTIRVRNASGEIGSYWYEDSGVSQSLSTEYKIKHRAVDRQVRLA